MARLLQGLVEQQDERRQDRHAGQHTEQDALRHHDAEVASQRERHEAQGQEARDRRDGAADDGRQRGADGVSHGLAFIGVDRALLIVAVPQEDGIVHRHGQLQHGGQCLGDVGNLAHEPVAAEVQQNGGANAGEEHKRDEPAVKEDHHGHARQHNGNGNVDRLLLLAQVLQIRHEGGHAGDEALLARNGANFSDGVHCLVRGGRGVEKHGHHRRVAGVEGVIELVGQKLHRDGRVHQGVVPQDRLHMLDGFELFLQGGNVLFRHILHDDEGECALAEVLQQCVLPDDGVHVVRQIIEHVVVDPGLQHAEHSRDHQKHREDQDRDAAAHDRFGKSHGLTSFLIKFRIQNIRLLVPDDLDHAARDAEVQDALCQHRDAEQDQQRPRAVHRAEHEQQPGQTRHDRKRQDQPPRPQAEALRIRCRLDLEQAVGQNADAEHQTEEAHKLHGTHEHDQPEHDQQDPIGQIELKRQPVQIAGKIPHQLHRAESDHHAAHQNAEQLHGKVGHRNEQHTEHAVQRRKDDVARLRRAHEFHGTHESTSFDFWAAPPGLPLGTVQSIPHRPPPRHRQCRSPAGFSDTEAVLPNGRAKKRHRPPNCHCEAPKGPCNLWKALPFRTGRR